MHEISKRSFWWREREKLRQMRLERWSYRRIAKHYNYSPGRIGQVISALGLTNIAPPAPPRASHCKCCGNEIPPERRRSLYCSSECGQKGNNQTRDKNWREKAKPMADYIVWRRLNGDSWQQISFDTGMYVPLMHKIVRREFKASGVRQRVFNVVFPGPGVVGRNRDVRDFDALTQEDYDRYDSAAQEPQQIETVVDDDDDDADE